MGNDPRRDPQSRAGQTTRSIPISQVGRLPKSRSRTVFRRDTRYVSLRVADPHNLEHFIVIPPDGGYGWIIVTVAFVANFLIDGVSYTFGIFLNELSEEFKVHPSKVALITSFMGGFYYLTGPVTCALCNKYGFRFVGFIGGLTSAGIFAGASVLNDFLYFVILMGVCTGMAFNFIYTPTLLLVGFYFERYRLLATTISVVGTSFGIVVFPLIFEKDVLLGEFNWRWKFRILSGLFFILSLLMLAFRPIRPTLLLERTAYLLDVDSTRSLDSFPLSESRNLNIKRIFDQYHNVVYPTVAEYATSVHIYPKKPDEPFTYLAIPPELNDSASIFGSIGSLNHLEQMSFAQHYYRFGWWRSLFWCCKGPHPRCRRCRSGCIKCANFCCAIRELNRPMYRDDILYQGCLSAIPEYIIAKSRNTIIPVDIPEHLSKISRSISYHMAVSRVISQRDIMEQPKCVCCPEAIIRVLITMIDVRLFKSISFCLLTLSGFLTMVGLYIPFIFIVERARELGFKAPWPTQLLTIMGIANMIGRIVCALSSYSSSYNPMVITWLTLIIGGTTVALSIFSISAMSNVVMVMTFGSCVASFTMIRTDLLVNIVGLENLTNGFGISILFYGLAVLVGIQLSAFLVTTYGTYKYCFLMAGCSLALSGLILIPINRVNRYERKKRRYNVTFIM